MFMNTISLQHAYRMTIAALLAGAVLMLAGCPSQTTSISVSQNSKTGTTVTITHTIKWDPPGSYLATLDTSQALLNLSLTNATISSTSGTANLSVEDLTTGQTVGQETFGYVVRGTSVYAQDPTSVYNWLQQFTSYADVDVIVTVPTTLQSTSAGFSSSTSNAQYQGVTYASATFGWEYTPPSPPCASQQAPGSVIRPLCPPPTN